MNYANCFSYTDLDNHLSNCSNETIVPEIKLRRVLTIERNDGTPILTIDKIEEIPPVAKGTYLNRLAIKPLQIFRG